MAVLVAGLYSSLEWMIQILLFKTHQICYDVYMHHIRGDFNVFKATDLNQWKCVAITLCWLSFKTPAELHVLAREVPLMKVGFHVYLMPWFAELSVNANGDEEGRFSKEVALLVTSQSDICCLFMHPSMLFSQRSTSTSRNTSSVFAFVFI